MAGMIIGASTLSGCSNFGETTGMKKGTQYDDTVKVQNLHSDDKSDSVNFYLNTEEQKADNNWYSAMREKGNAEWHHRTDPLLAYETRKKETIDSIPEYNLQSLKVVKDNTKETGVVIGKPEIWNKEEKMVNNAIEKFYQNHSESYKKSSK